MPPWVIPQNDAPIYITLRTYWANGAYYSRTWEYQTLSGGVDTGTQITSPLPGSILDDQITTVEWESEPQSSRFLFKVGTTPGGHDLQSIWLTGPTRSAAMVVPLTGEPVYLTLRTYWSNGVYYERSFEYQTATSGADSGSQITNPTPGSTLTDALTAVEWEADSLANRFLFYVGTTSGGHNIQSVWLTEDARTAAVAVPLNGQPLYVTLRTYRSDGSYYIRTYEYQTATSGSDSGTQIISPIPGSTLYDESVTFNWEASSQVTNFLLRVGTSVNGYDIENTYLTSTTRSYDVTVPINDASVYVRLRTYWANGVLLRSLLSIRNRHRG